ncbi:MAG: family 10 glycosylhydrolase [Candidatus Neomarinimicrobiota bacterium]
MTALLILSLCNAGLSQSHLGLWIVRDQLYSKEKIDAFVEFAAVNDFQDIFVQVRGRGDAFYRSDLVVRNENLNNGWDPLEYTLTKAHTRGLRVHAWLNIYLIWSADQKPKNENHLLFQHPDWCAVDENGVKDIQRHSVDFANLGTEGIYLSPLLPEVRQYLLDVLRELATNYEIDGIHLDYVRYAKNCFDYNPVGRILFRNQYGIDPLLLTISDKSFYKGLELAEIDSLAQQWDDFRREAISKFIRDARTMLKATKPAILFSAAVKPDPVEARKYFFQDWEYWLMQDWLDFAVLMNYSRDTDQFTRVLKRTNPAVKRDQMWIGIGVYNQSQYDAMTKTLLVLNQNFTNIVFFSYETFAKSPDYYPVVRKAFEITRMR